MSGAVLVLGGTGQVGEGIVRRLVVADRETIAIRHRHESPLRGPSLRWVDGDIRDRSFDIAGLGCETVISVVSLWALPPRLPELVEGGLRRLVCFGSTSLHGKRGTQNPAEQAMVRHLAEAEEAIADQCRTADVAWTILRPTLIYGKGRDRNVASVARFIARTGFYPIAPPAAGLRQPVHAEDLAEAAVAVVDVPETFGRAYDIGGAETLIYREMIGRIFDIMERPRRLIPVPALAPLVGALGRATGRSALNADMVRRMNRDLAFDDGTAARDFGYTPRPFLAGGRADLGL